MPKVTLKNVAGESIGEIELSDAIFGIEPNVPVMHEVVRAQLANRRHGTQSALTRTEVRGGGRKIYRQKGTGRARHASNRAPIFVHGGVVFAPKPRLYKIHVNKKVRRLAMKSALSAQVQDECIVVVDDLKMDAPKTAEMKKVFANLGVGDHTLVVLPDVDVNVSRSIRNIKGAKTLLVNTLNVVDILKYDSLVLTREAVEKIQEVYA
ncbi:MAG: 50S ribosomal protein L4 [Clostridia bacterium]|jgi:large subunit ribosomal protein L4|nr:50S ribosomal protein L4 [Clostridia bacterium]MBR3195892.1 50S ribosomal protein L4 [Clostridia bacterium]